MRLVVNIFNDDVHSLSYIALFQVDASQQIDILEDLGRLEGVREDLVGGKGGACIGIGGGKGAGEEGAKGKEYRSFHDESQVNPITNWPCDALLICCIRKLPVLASVFR